MQASKLLQFAAVLLSAWLSVGSVAAADLSANAPSTPPPLVGEVKWDGGPGRMPATRAYVTSGTNRFAFLVPAGLRMDGAMAQGIIRLVSNDDSYHLNFRIVGPLPPDAKEVAPEPCRELLLSAYPGAEILEEFPLAAASRTGPAFDLRCRNSSDMPQSIRVAFIPSAAGLLEFSLVAHPAKFPQAQSSFNTMLLTFRSNDSGPLEDTPRPDQI
jgi:hypothetical protein